MESERRGRRYEGTISAADPHVTSFVRQAFRPLRVSSLVAAPRVGGGCRDGPSLIPSRSAVPAPACGA